MNFLYSSDNNLTETVIPENIDVSDKVSDKMVEEKINELRTKYALFAAILERIHNMDLKETTIATFAIDGMESLLKVRALLILGS